MKGINQWRLGALRPHLMVENAPVVTSSNSTVISTASQNSAQFVGNGKLPGGYM